jgi:hypothetical protein
MQALKTSKISTGTLADLLLTTAAVFYGRGRKVRLPYKNESCDIKREYRNGSKQAYKRVNA